MKHFFSQLASQLAKVAMVVFAAVILFVGVASPAIAFGNSSSSPSEGTAQMNNLQETSKQAVKQEPRNRQEVQRKAQQGPNEVQGDADLHGMNVPNNSKQTTTVRKQAEDALKKVTPGN